MFTTSVSSCGAKSLFFKIELPRGKKSLPTRFSRTELFPLLYGEKKNIK